jgi:dTMP kinase
LDLAWLKQLRARVVGATEPGLTLILDLPVATGLGRAREQQRYERMGQAFHEKLRKGFRAIAQEAPECCTVIDATHAIDAVAADVRAAVAKRFGVTL